MTRADTEFLEHLDRYGAAGYFESSDPMHPGRSWTVQYNEPDDILTLRRDSEPHETEERLKRFFRRAPNGAALGYVGFDAVGLFEPLLRRRMPSAPFPLGELALVRRIRRRPAPLRERRQGRLAPFAREPRSSSLPRDEYCRSVRRLRGAIRAGEAYQVVLANRRRWARPDDLWARAAALRSAERFAYFYAIKFDERAIVAASPESVLEVDGGRAFVNPIAGTRPIGRAGRRRLRLSVDPKELAEHRMLVDLARNDLGRISVPGGVRLLWSERPTRYARLEHLVSHVAGQLRPDVSPLEALAATFPAGTVSGAPKIRATELLRREERTWRGPYAGAVGLLDAAGNATWALNIRSAFVAGPSLYTAAGAGIVYRSRPAREYQETLTKLAQVERVMLGEAR